MLTDKTRTGHVVVVGAGVMGSGIAALMANLGWRVSLLDRVPEGAAGDARSAIARAGLARAAASRPPAFALPEYSSRVRAGNIEDHLDWLADADWVVEAASEDPAVKRQVMALVAEHAGPATVVSSNTSALPSHEVLPGCPRDLCRRYLGTHFFNPPRYMQPIELIAPAATDAAVAEGFARFADRVLGKTVIRARDTPGFISTRLGMYSLSKTMELAIAHGLTVEETDYLTGPLIGRPRTGTFRLADVVGVDILLRIVDYLSEALPDDAAYAGLRIPAVVRRLADDGRIGSKAAAGFYRREKDGSISSLDLATLDYRPRIEPRPVADAVEALPLPERLQATCYDLNTWYGLFLGEALTDTLRYIANITPQVADSLLDVDAAIRGGFGWEMGPFEVMDALAPADWWTPHKPRLVDRLKGIGRERFYGDMDGHPMVFEYHGRKMVAVPKPPGVLRLEDARRTHGTVLARDDASLVDLGDGVACLSWSTRGSALDPGLVEFLHEAVDRAARDFAALVLAGGGDTFCAGYDLRWLADRIEAGGWAAIDDALRAFQQLAIGLDRGPIPLVGAVRGYALGGGCELMLGCGAVQAAAETYAGLPEANVGLVPAGGGVVRMLERAMEKLPPAAVLERADPFPLLQPIWDNIRLARISSSADEARALGYLRPRDAVTLHPDRLLHDARARALLLAEDWRPATPGRVPVTGEDGLARFRWELHLLRRAGQVAEHDARIADRLAWVLTGGDLVHPAAVAEDYLLDLEREAFMSVAGAPEALARVRHFLQTGKPMRRDS